MTDNELDLYNDQKISNAVSLLALVFFFFATPAYFSYEELEFNSLFTVVFSCLTAFTSVALLITIVQLIKANSKK